MIAESFDLSEDWFELSPEEKLSVLKATVSVPEVAQLMGLEADEGDKIPSPFNPTERTPSCHLYDDHWYDFATGKGGDIFDLVMALNPGTTLGQAVEALRNKAVRVGKQYGDVEAQKPREPQDFSAQFAGEPVLELLGLDVRHYGIVRDANGDVLVPHRDHDGIYGVKVRWRAGGKGSWAGSVFTKRLYDPLGWRPGHVPATKLILVEGESDSWAMRHSLKEWGGDEFFDVLALPAGAGTWKDHWVEKDTTEYNEVWVCMDNDTAGKAARDKLMLKVGYSRAKELKVPALYNDARSAIEAGWRPFR